MSHTIADFFPGSFRKPELASLDHVEVAPHHQAGAEIAIKLVLKSPYSPLIAQLADRAGTTSVNNVLVTGSVVSFAISARGRACCPILDFLCCSPRRCRWIHDEQCKRRTAHRLRTTRWLGRAPSMIRSRCPTEACCGRRRRRPLRGRVAESHARAGRVADDTPVCTENLIRL
jgi:hypothetical protein